MDKATREQLIKVQDLIAALPKEPKPGDLAPIQRCFADNPDLWQAVTMTHMAAMTAIEALHPGAGAAVVMRANYEGQCRALGYATAPPLEKGLIEHVALCLIRLEAVERGYTKVMSESHTLTLGDYWERRLSAAQRRYLRAVETLARVRRLRLPALQVNIGENQVNVATGAPGAAQLADSQNK